MSLQGLPDFQRALQGEGFQIFYPYEGAGSFLVTPDRLEVAESPEGRPEFVLEFVRGQNPALPPAPYGVLDLKVTPRYPMESALRLVRSLQPGALSDLAIFSGGFLRFRLEGNAGGAPADLQAPISLNWNGLTTGRYVLRLSQDSALLLKGALQGEIVALSALAELEMTGVAARLPLRVRFNPATLLSSLNAMGNDQRQITREKVLGFFHQDPASLPVEVAGDVTSPGEFSETMTDWVRARFASFIPSPEDDKKPHWTLTSASEVGSGSFEWDLSQPLQTYRPFLFSLHPLESAQQLVKARGIEAVTRNTVVPSIPTGLFPLSISANLPACRPGILAVGVTLKAKPRLPFRPQAVIESVEFTPPDDRAGLSLRLSPGESPEYTYSTFIIREDSSGVTELAGAETPHAGDSLHLSPADFPMNLIPLHASQALLDLAVLDCTCQWKQSGAAVEQQAKLDSDQPAIGLALPKDAEEATIQVRARSRSGGSTVTFGPIPARGLELGLHSFREYGPHTIRIECTFSDNTPLLAVDLLPEDRPETPAEITVIALTPAQPRKDWTYLAASFFRPGYRFRLHPSADETPKAWSEVQSPFESLKLSTGGRG